MRALNAPAGPYVVVKRLPKRDRQFEYQIRSVIEPYERVAPGSWRNLGVHPCALDEFGLLTVQRFTSDLQNWQTVYRATIEPKPGNITS
jgi:hypothetical protein